MNRARLTDLLVALGIVFGACSIAPLALVLHALA